MGDGRRPEGGSMDKVVAELISRRPAAPPRARHQKRTKGPSHKISPEEKRKAQLVGELVSTEATYIAHLDIVIKHFMDPLSVLDLLNAADLRKLFGEIRTIRLVNQVLYDQLKSGELVQAFRSLGPYLKTYASYSRNFPTSQAVLERERSRRKFAEWLKAVEAEEGVRGLKLPALLITPIQRLPRYRLLLTELALLSHGPEKQDLLEVVEEVEVATDLVNESVAEREAEGRLLEIQGQLDSAAPRLLVPGRRFLRTGSLHKLLASRREPQWDLRTLFLFSDILLYGKPPTPPRTKIRVACVIPLRHCEACLLMGQNVMRITCPGEELFFRSHSHLDIQTWTDAINAQIRTSREDRATLRKESSSRLPMRRATLRAARRQVSTLTSRFHQSRHSPAKRLPFSPPNRRGSASVSSEGSASSLSTVFSRIRTAVAGLTRKRPASTPHVGEPPKRARLHHLPSSAQAPPLSPVQEEEEPEGVEEVRGSWAAVVDENSRRTVGGGEWWRQFESPQPPAQARDSSTCVLM